jgi:KaiC/GvpD/RAD55 family RecA-like ATPase
MYNLGPAFRETAVDSGTNLLVSGPPASGARRLAFETLGHGVRNGEAALVITTRFGAGRVLEDLDALFDVDSAPLGIVDCVTRRQDRTRENDSRVSYVTSPAALTRIGIKFSEFVSEFRTRDIDGIRVVFDSLSTLLPYLDTGSVFRFIHVLGEQIADADGLGVSVIHPPAHDEETRETIEELFDGRVTVDGNAVTGIEL